MKTIIKFFDTFKEYIPKKLFEADSQSILWINYIQEMNYR